MANKPFKKLRFSLTGDTYSPVDEQARQNIGDLSQLETTNKSNLVEAINEAAQSEGSGSGVPSGGSKGQVLTKLSSVEGDAGWEYPPVMSATGNDPSNLTVTWNENYTTMDFYMRQELVQAEYTGNDIHLKLVKAYITTTAPDYNSKYHFEFGAITQIVNGTATIATLVVLCNSPSAHSGVGIYTETNIGVTDEAVQNAVDNYLELHPSVGGSFSNAAKNALLNLLEKVAYTDDGGESYWNSLRQELFSVAVVSISATFNQGSAVIYDTDSLDILRQYLTVIATYSDTTTEEVYTYSLSGTLTAGTSTITVEYNGKTTSFTVSVSTESWTWVFNPATDGLLTAQSYIYTGNMGTKTEEISNDLLHIVVPQTGSENNGYQIRFGNGADGYSVTEGHLRMKVKFAGVCTLGSGIKANGFRINMSLGGTKGTKLMVIKEGSVYNLYRASTSSGSSVYNFIQTVQTDTWYIVDMKISSSGIVMELDGTTIYSGTNWATNSITYCGLYMVASAQSKSSLRENTDVYIEYIKLLSGGVN